MTELQPPWLFLPQPHHAPSWPILFHQVSAFFPDVPDGVRSPVLYTSTFLSQHLSQAVLEIYVSMSLTLPLGQHFQEGISVLSHRIPASNTVSGTQ